MMFPFQWVMVPDSQVLVEQIVKLQRAMAKKQVTETGSRVVDGCLQLHGGYGYLGDYGIEKLVRDLRVHQILEGTNEIMRLIISRQMIADAA